MGQSCILDFAGLVAAFATLASFDKKYSLLPPASIIESLTTEASIVFDAPVNRIAHSDASASSTVSTSTRFVGCGSNNEELVGLCWTKHGRLVA